jgi:hypothetical protein
MVQLAVRLSGILVNCLTPNLKSGQQLCSHGFKSSISYDKGYASLFADAHIHIIF